MSSKGQKKITTTGSTECSNFSLYSSFLKDTRLNVIVIPRGKVLDARHELSDGPNSHADRRGSGKCGRSIAPERGKGGGLLWEGEGGGSGELAVERRATGDDGRDDEPLLWIWPDCI